MWFTQLSNKKLMPGDVVEFSYSISTCDLFGQEDVIPKGTRGMITDRNVTNTAHPVRNKRNYEITHGNNERVLLTHRVAIDALKVVRKYSHNR